MKGQWIYEKTGIECNYDLDVEGLSGRLGSDGFLVQQVYSPIVRDGKYILVGNNDLDSLVGLAKAFGVRVMLTDLVYLNQEKYMIDPEYADGMPSLAEEIEAFNESVKEIDFSVPYEMHVMFRHDAATFGVCFTNRLMEDLVSSTVEERVASMRELHEDEFRNAMEERQAMLREYEDRFIAEIAEDPEFSKCTNQASRTEYLKRLATDGEHDDLLDLLCDGLSYLPVGKLKVFGDRAWAVYKARK